MLKGKRISILGDSVSTYIGVSNDSGANSSLVYNKYFYKPPFPLEKTYWQILMSEFSLELCVNNSYSGANMSGADDFSSGLNRASVLSRGSGEKPDIIIVFMGLNDLGRGIDAEKFSSDYKTALSIIRKDYPSAEICCVNIPDRDPFLKARAQIFNEAISRAADAAGAFVADLFNSRLNNDFYYMNTLDGLHPDEDGMKIIAEIIGKSIRDYFKL